MDTDENDTRYVKPSRKSSPQKADHAHEYLRVFAMLRIRRFDGTITDQRYRYDLPDECVVCGHTRRYRRTNVVTEIEVAPREFKTMQTARKN